MFIYESAEGSDMVSAGNRKLDRWASDRFLCGSPCILGFLFHI